MYDSQTALIANYINPIIGDMEVQDITTRVVDKYIQRKLFLLARTSFLFVSN